MKAAVLAVVLFGSIGIGLTAAEINTAPAKNPVQEASHDPWNFLTEHRSGWVCYPSRVGSGIGCMVGCPLSLAMLPINIPLAYAVQPTDSLWALYPLGASCWFFTAITGGGPYLIYEGTASLGASSPKPFPPNRPTPIPPKNAPDGKPIQ